MKKFWLMIPAFALIACGGNETETTDTTEKEPEVKVEEQVEEVIPEVMFTPDTSADETIQKYLKDKKWEGVKHESGMYVVTDEAGEGDARPNLLDEVTIHYQGYLLDGFKFDGTADAPATFPLQNLILGWQIGIPMFGKGGKGKLIIPPGLGYGPQANGDIPANSVLMFEIELVDWQKAPKQQQIFW